MLKIENTVTPSPEWWRMVIMGARNPKNSWSLSDSEIVYENVRDSSGSLVMGSNDHDLLMRLGNAGTDHAKYRRMIPVIFDITAPMFIWKEIDTYKIGTVRNSCSTMHKVHVAPFTIDMFSHEGCDEVSEATETLEIMIRTLEHLRQQFNETQDKKYWRAIIELLPCGYNMKSTLTLNYEVLRNMYHSRKNHKLSEWHTFCDWIKNDLPYSELITLEE